MTTRDDHQPLAPRAAWYPDDADQSLLRYWDGERWTKHVRPAPAESRLDGAVAAEGTGWVRRHRPEIVLLLGWALLAGAGAVVAPGGSGDSNQPGGPAAPSAAVASAPSNSSPSEDAPPVPSERDVSGCALEVQPMVTPIAREAESTQRSLLEEARLAANELAPGSSRQRALSSLVDSEAEIDRQSGVYARFVDNACPADPHLTTKCTRSVISSVGESVSDANRELARQADSQPIAAGNGRTAAVDRYQAADFELSNRLTNDAVMADGFGGCARGARGLPIPELVPPTQASPSAPGNGDQ